MKKIICLVLAVVLAISMALTVSASSNTKPLLSQMSDIELLLFLEESNLVAPTMYSSLEEYLTCVRFLVNKIEGNYNVQFHFGSSELYAFSERLKQAVNEYYGYSGSSLYARSSNSENVVEDSTVLGSWNSSYADTNCYAYAIGYSHAVEPGVVEWEIENDDWMVRPTPSYMYTSVSTIADYIKTDLEALGYTVGNPTTIAPGANVDITAHDRIICVRREETYTGDFHLMVLEDDGMWYHKFRNCVPMRYNSTPSNGNGWVYEGLNNEGYFRDEDMVYASTIYYIIYTIPCTDIEYVYCGNNQHIRTCADCGKTKGVAMFCTYKNGVCSSCGRRQSSIIQSISESCFEG